METLNRITFSRESETILNIGS